MITCITSLRQNKVHLLRAFLTGIRSRWSPLSCILIYAFATLIKTLLIVPFRRMKLLRQTLTWYVSNLLLVLLVNRPMITRAWVLRRVRVRKKKPQMHRVRKTQKHQLFRAWVIQTITHFKLVDHRTKNDKENLYIFALAVDNCSFHRSCHCP